MWAGEALGLTGRAAGAGTGPPRREPLSWDCTSHRGHSSRERVRGAPCCPPFYESCPSTGSTTLPVSTAWLSPDRKEQREQKGQSLDSHQTPASCPRPCTVSKGSRRKALALAELRQSGRLCQRV